MYAETGLMFPYFQNFSPDVQQFDDFCHSHKSNACLGSLVQTSTVSDYDLGGEGDLFKAPEPIISCEEGIISRQELSVMDIESLQSEEFLSDVFYECKDILSKEAATETSPLSEVLNYKFPIKTDEHFVVKENVHPPGQIPKSASLDSLSSMESIHRAQMKPSFVNVTEVDFGNVYGMRRAFSEGDIKTLANGHGGREHSMEDRWQKLSRYRNKKTKRNFDRKIKYACRKALADSQPRIRGRFAKTE